MTGIMDRTHQHILSHKANFEGWDTFIFLERCPGQLLVGKPLVTIARRKMKDSQA
ncbi:hypothetical protein BDZ89DRAFT_1065734 [Hymenopellis radicata]|nr:hypothetical protein BDZ89DRAFT_1065734 [Hymenopellis radicata]